MSFFHIDLRKETQLQRNNADISNSETADENDCLLYGFEEDISLTKLEKMA